MNRICCLLLLVIFISCKTATVAQEKPKEVTKKPKIEKPKFHDVPQTKTTMDPSTIFLKGIVKGKSANATICNKVYSSVLDIEIYTVLDTGSSIVNMISTGQQITFPISKALLRNSDLKTEITVGNTISFIIKERLCQDMSQTIYEIINFSSKN